TVTDASSALNLLLSRKQIASVGLSADILREISKGFELARADRVLRKANKEKSDWIASEITTIVAEE
ncbi:MAG: hypothetical protein ACREBS_02575, partial [Nitrososphaerales archaeon]